MGKPDIEFEGRIGLICAPQDSREKNQIQRRLVIPIISECVLDQGGTMTNGKMFKYEFSPNLNREVFQAIRMRLEELHAGPGNFTNPVFKVINVNSTHTIDEIYNKPYPVRMSYDWASYMVDGAEPLEVIHKESIEKINVWSGYFNDMDDESVIEDDERHPFDFRLAINVEHKHSNHHDFVKSDCIMKREKKRTSFDMKAWVVDMTEVTVIGNTVSGGSSSTRYEVEAELKSELLFEQLNRRSAGKSHGAYQILNDFLYFLRDICFAFAPTSGTSKPGRYPELGSCEPSSELKRKYCKVTGSDVFPIIGDYIYQVLDEVKPVSSL
jgi:hypothetical protein